jgi:antitoxin CcdA
MRMEIVMTTAQTNAKENLSRTRQPAKRATNLSLSADVLDAAKSMRLNVSQLCDKFLREVVRHEQERRWRAEHSDFIAAYNATIDSEGLPLDEWRAF